MTPKIRVLVAPLVERTVPSKTFWAFLKIAARAPVDGYDITGADFMREDLARQRAGEKMLDSPRNTHLLMLDIDHDHPDDIVRRMIQGVIEDPSRKVIGALCFRRGPNYEPMAFIEDGESSYFPYPWPLGCVKVDQVGGGALLIAREVLETLPKPWFPFDYSKADRYPTTDITFCNAARAAGFSIHVDTRVVSPHLTDGWVAQNTFEAFVATNEAARKQLQEVGDDS